MRWLIATIALWTLLLVPTLCLGGAVAHPCVCAGANRNYCAGELICQDDPCAVGGPGTASLDFDRPSVPLPVVVAPAWILPQVVQDPCLSPISLMVLPVETPSAATRVLPLLI